MRIALFWSVSLLFLLGPAVARAEAGPEALAPSASPSLSPSASPIPPIGMRLEGTLLEKGTRTPLEGLNVYLLPSKRKAVTEKGGRFVFEGVPAGPFQWVVNAAGYERLEQNDVLTENEKPEPRALFLTRVSYDTGVYETTIYDKAEKRDDNEKSLTQKDFATIPGANSDPIKAVQNLPGINRPQSFSSQVIIEGSAPQDTKYTIEGHDVPLIFHFGGLSSVVYPEAVSRVDYLAAGFGPEYGDALGGIIGVWMRSPQTDRLHGHAFMDLLNSGVLLEGPVAGGGLMVGGRFSYIGLVLKAALSGNSSFDLTAVPEYSDALALYDTKLGPKDSLRVAAVGSHDTLAFLFANPVSKDNSGRGTVSFNTSFVRLIPEYTHRYDEDTATRLSLGVGKDWIHRELNDLFVDQNEMVYTFRGEHERKLLDDWTGYFGADAEYQTVDVSFVAPGSGPPSGGGGGGLAGIQTVANTRETATYYATDLGLYWRNLVHRSGSPWSFQPNLRYDYFTILHEGVPQPRAAVRYALDQWTSVFLNGGYYAQEPLGQEIDRAVGNPDLHSERAYHASLGLDKDFREGASRGWTLSTDFFYKYLYQLVVPTSNFIVRNGALTPERYTNDGTGHAFGWEVQLKFDLKPWSGWLAYTLSRSTRREPGNGEHLFQYDQTHILTAVAEVDLGRNWALSTRLRYTTGDPLTPPNGSIFDSDADSFLRLNGPFYSSRFGAFFELDARVDKKWIYDNWILTAYLDVENLTNRQNPEQINYSYDYSQSQTVSLLPILPTIGLKGEF